MVSAVTNQGNDNDEDKSETETGPAKVVIKDRNGEDKTFESRYDPVPLDLDGYKACVGRSAGQIVQGRA